LRSVFADTLYWIGLVNPKDQWSNRVRQARKDLGVAKVITTQEVLTELLNALSKDLHLRASAVLYVEAILINPGIEVLPQSQITFLSGLTLYKSRRDKRYSLTDCISMMAMRQHGLNEVLTYDRHFEQEGFTNLIK
jgi:predicted nucleic acid-binding protein